MTPREVQCNVWCNTLNVCRAMTRTPRAPVVLSASQSRLSLSDRYHALTCLEKVLSLSFVKHDLAVHVRHAFIGGVGLSSVRAFARKLCTPDLNPI